MAEYEHKIEKLCEVQCCFTDALKSEVSKGVYDLDSKEAGEVADIIKDLAAAQKYMCESEYYKEVVMAMKEKAEYPYGYTETRTLPYKPYVDQKPYVEKYFDNNDWIKNNNDWAKNNNATKSEYGEAYDHYKDAKRHYEKTKSLDDKHHMDSYINEHLEKSIESIKEMWTDADPLLKDEIKMNITNLVNEM